ncbi:hypothetical protein [Bittarella massiliensis (ex Durand et al. 2017)]|uniref:hypothetical protein n=1 Tax=Bittarella massiliensis (ex Durand et al. 2017) TaxID=1720313 RepID=UPI001AA12609|nr:hypothetical protein [Bittarella massiliensis (ex Durand et al. 2017)]MBO1680377.1 hypothetical protein [Bittarella massiliensis (ex Durand et al. 2017)]
MKTCDFIALTLLAAAAVFCAVHAACSWDLAALLLLGASLLLSAVYLIGRTRKQNGGEG